MNSTVYLPECSPTFPITNTTQLLISVTSVEEAKIALENGADIIDLKNPSAGALGALSIEQIQFIVDFMRSELSPIKKKTSATIGDLPMEPELLLWHVNQLTNTGVDIIKIGFFESDNYQPCLDALQTVTQAGLKLIAVLFVESNYPTSLIKAIRDAGFIGIMLDTAKKNGLTLMDYYSEIQRTEFAQEVFKHHLLLGVAGSLKMQHIVDVKEINPTYIGFRGGVCHANQRELALDIEKIKEIRKIL